MCTAQQKHQRCLTNASKKGPFVKSFDVIQVRMVTSKDEGLEGAIVNEGISHFPTRLIDYGATAQTKGLEDAPDRIIFDKRWP